MIIFNIHYGNQFTVNKYNRLLFRRLCHLILINCNALLNFPKKVRIDFWIALINDTVFYDLLLVVAVEGDLGFPVGIVCH